MQVRPARGTDLDAIGRILNTEIAGGTASWKTERLDRPALQAWFDNRIGTWAACVAEKQEPVGFSALGCFRPGAGYFTTVEHSVYVEAAHQGKGLASALLGTAVEWARAAGYHRMIGGVSADQTASLAFHRKMGFVQAGHLPEVGRKNGRWLDLILMVRALD